MLKLWLLVHMIGNRVSIDKLQTEEPAQKPLPSALAARKTGRGGCGLQEEMGGRAWRRL